MIQKYIHLKKDLDEFFTYLNDFLNKSIKDSYQSTEFIVDQQTLLKHVKDIKEFGLIPDPESLQNDFSIWNFQEEESQSRLQNLISLIYLGSINGGLSYLVHQSSLSAYIQMYLKTLNLEHPYILNEPFFVILQGNYGLGRNLLAKFLYKKDLSKEEKKHLREYFNYPNPITIQIPEFINDFAFFTLEKDADDFTLNLAKIHDKITLYPSHGLDEIPTVDAKYEILDSISVPIDFYINLLTKEILAILSISTGRLIHALQKALKYTHERIQGGRIIYTYPAIQNLLYNADSIIELSINSLYACCDIFTPHELLLKVLRIKKQIFPLLLQGASDCLQTHGGYGYMKDYGLEKVYRDINHFKQFLGTSNEISLFLGEIETKETNHQYSLNYI